MYDDYRKKSRTQLLREKVAALEKKLAEFEANPQTNAQSTLVNDSPAGESSSSFATDSPFGGGSPSGLDWQSPEAQTLEASSSLHWPDPIASNNWVTGNTFQDYSSDLSPLRQTTPISNVNISSETQQYL